jgi:hypothetical protein
MRALKLILVVTVLLSPELAVAKEQPAFTIDATKQTMRPPRGRGPFPGSATPGHSYGFPIRLDLEFPSTKVASQGSVLVDFLLTNVGTEPVKLPCSTALLAKPDIKGTSILTLWITSDAVIDQYIRDLRTGQLFKSSIVGLSAELDGYTSDPKSFCVLNPGKSLTVHAQAGVALKMGTHSFTGHAELSPYLTGIRTPETADSHNIRKTLSIAGTTSSR